jgi:light-regulated signal transduction histidine kinase (bacteriophytochrome)
MRALISALLDYSRISTRKEAFKPVVMEEVVKEALANLTTRLEETGGKVEIGNLPVVEAAHHQMVQLMQNLIGNALKFHRKNVPPRVKISCNVRESSVSPEKRTPIRGRFCEIRVEDNGIGFDEKYAERIFSPFQRLHGRSQYEGAGMGLAICRKIVERHRGRIKATSEPGDGATFIITLPLKNHGKNER